MAKQFSKYQHYFKPASPSRYPEGYKHVLVKSHKVEKLKKMLWAEDVFASDTETTGLCYETDQLVGLSVAFEDRRGFYLPFRHVTDSQYNLPIQALYDIYEIILAKKTLWWNFSFDANMIEKEGLIMTDAKFLDVSIPVWLTDTNVRYPSLSDSERHFLGWSRPNFKDIVKEVSDFSYLSPADPQTVQYAAGDALSTYLLAKKIVPIIKKECPFILKLDNNIVNFLYHIEKTEISLDKDYILKIEHDIKEAIQPLKDEIFAFFGYTFNLDSTKEVGDALASKNLTTGSYTPKKQQMSIKIELLEKMDSPVAKQIATYQSLANRLGSYVMPLKREAFGRGFARFSYKNTAAPTGRLAAGSEKKNKYFTPMNIQAIEKSDFVKKYAHKSDAPGNVLGWIFNDEKSEHVVEYPDPEKNVRKVFKADPGFYFVKFDYEGQELRLPANLAKEPLWLNTFLKGEDVHTNVAYEIWGEDQYDQSKRKKIKPVNFGALYGATDWTLSKQLNITLAEAAEILSRWWKAVPKLTTWVDHCKRKARRDGFIHTPFGRPRRLYHYFASPNRKERAFAYRTAINTQIQGGGADILKIALNRLLRKALLQYDKYVKFRFTVHDEIDVLIRKDRIDLLDYISELMTLKRKDWPVPMTVGVEIGNSWGDLVEFHKVDGVWIPKFIN